MIFTPGCNLRCRFCHNPSLVLPSQIATQELISEESFFSFLSTRKGLLEGVVITGGEPTLHHDLVEFCQKIKAMGFFVKLDTNGRSPDMISLLIEKKVVDYIAMDIKSASFLLRQHLLQTKENTDSYIQTIQLLKKSIVSYEFRTTLIKPYHTVDEFVKILDIITGAEKYSLQTYRDDITLDKQFLGSSFSYGEMQEFQKIATSYVKKCCVI